MAPSPWRRMLWLIVISVTFFGMTSMTCRVIKEYLAYPSVLRAKSETVSQLAFPAVTVCGLNLVPSINAIEAGLQYIEDMRHILESLPTYNVSITENNRCLKDPMCYWHWFEDKCYCEKSPCNTLYCYPDSDKTDTRCQCSKLLCKWKGTNSSDACRRIPGTCVCNSSFIYPLNNIPDEYYAQRKTERCIMKGKSHCEPAQLSEDDRLPPDFNAALKALNVDEKVGNLLKKIKAARTSDLKDVERHFTPDLKTRNNYAVPLDTLILSCSYGLKPCTKDDITTIYSPSFGKCYMINYEGEEDVESKGQVKVAKNPGRSNGLQLYLQSKKEDSIPLLTKELGARIVVHDPRSMPFASENGFDVRPEDITSVSVQYVETNRLGPPWGACAKDGEVLPSNYSANPYNQRGCKKHCLNEVMHKRCNCFHPKYLTSKVIPIHQKLCNISDTSKDRCYASVFWDDDNGMIKCTCPPPCQERTYETFISSGKINADFFQFLKTAKSLKMHNGKPKVAHLRNKFNIMGVLIYFNSFSVSYINETALYSWESLVANIGGNLGLFLGLSLVTFLEILEFIAEVITRVFQTSAIKSLNTKIQSYAF